MRLPTTLAELSRLEIALERRLRAVRAALSLLRAPTPSPSRVPVSNPAGHRDVPTAASWEDAKAAGAARYYSDKPCNYGHAPVRYTVSRNCVVCARDAQWANEQAWRDLNQAPPGLTNHERNVWRRKRKAELRELREIGLA